MTCNDWMDTPLGDITKWTSGGTPSKSNPLFWNGNIPWISAKTLTSGWIDSSDLTITEEGLEAGSNLAPTQSVLMLVRGSGLFNHRYIGIVKKPVAFNQDIKCLQAKANLNPLFLYYLLQGYDNEIVGMLEATSIGAGKFDTKRLQEMKVSLPPLPEQHSIAATLSCLDEKIELNNRMNKTLEEMAQAVFKSWFVDFEPFQDGEFVDSELGRIPKGWRVGTLGEIISTNLKSYSNTENWSYVDYLDTGSMTENTIIQMQKIQLGVDKLPSRARRKVSKNDIVYSTVRPIQKHYGILTNPSAHMLVSTGFTVITSAYTPFVYCFLTLKSIIEHLDAIANQSVSTYPSIRADHIESLRLCIPPKDTLHRFCSSLEAIYQFASVIQDENSKLSIIRDTILPKLMNGEILIETEVTL
ncbi:MAG: restriction endonuclease subunit S [Eubacteriales bacterium]|nr:restriction endonuclease subunit S [Eubacteriales bacterium]